MREKRAGFTLIELLVAIAIIGILASVGFVSFTASLQKSRDARRKADLDQVAKALESYNLDNGVYPGSCGGQIVGCSGGACSFGQAFTNEGKTYMGTLPSDPIAGQRYVYTTSANGRSFQLYAHLESEADSEVVIGVGLSCSGDERECNYGVSSADVGLTPHLSENSDC